MERAQSLLSAKFCTREERDEIAAATGLVYTEAGGDIVTIEVMTDRIDKHWWRNFRTRLETLLRQEEVVIRAHEFIKL